MEMRIVQKIYTGSSRGVVSKGWYVDEYGGKYLVKGNTENGFEPYSEVISSIVLDTLGVEHIEYFLLDKDLFPEIKVYGSDVEHVSVCREYTLADYEQEIPLWRYLEVKSQSRKIDHWGLTLNHINLDELKKILVLDAFLANSDRHLSNIVVIARGEDIRLMPPFDFGASLGSILSYNEIKDRKGLGKSKPFKESHDRQLMLVNRYSKYKITTKYNKVEFIREVLSRVEEVLSLMPERRAGVIKELLCERIDYLDSLITWKGEKEELIWE